MTSIAERQTSAARTSQQFVTCHGEALFFKTSWPWHLLSFSPFFLLVWFVSRFGVNVPVIDEWAWAYWFHAVRFRKATFDDLFAVANDHRIVFPKLIWTPLAFATHGNLRIEMMVNLVPALIVFLVFYKLALRQTNYTGRGLVHLANLSTSVFLFSLVQYETWLWALAGGYLFVQASVALAIGVCFVETLRPWTRLGLAACCCFIASFSAAQGLASWLALFPCIAHLQTGERETRKFYTWCLLFAASIAIYSYHFSFLPAGQDSTLDFLYHPLRSASFFLALLGSPFSQGDATTFVSMACLMGGLILLALLGCLLVLRKDQRKDIIAPWLSVAMFGLLFAAMATAGRSNLLVFAMRTRYAAGTIFVAIAVIQLGRLVYARKESRIYLLFLGALWALIIAGSLSAVSIAHHLKEGRARAKLFVGVLRYIDPVTDDSPESLTAPLFTGSGFRAPAELLNEIGFLHLASNMAFVDHPCPECGSFESADGSGDLMHLRRHKDELTVSGWASLPRGRGLPKVVMISYGEQKTFITGAVVGWVNRPDIAALQRDPRYLHSGWTVSFPAKFLPLGEGVLRAWVYDWAEKKFVRLPEAGREKKFSVETQ